MVLVRTPDSKLGPLVRQDAMTSLRTAARTCVSSSVEKNKLFYIRLSKISTLSGISTDRV